MLTADVDFVIGIIRQKTIDTLNGILRELINELLLTLIGIMSPG